MDSRSGAENDGSNAGRYKFEGVTTLFWIV